jgi:hypothetical protein
VSKIYWTPSSVESEVPVTLASISFHLIRTSAGGVPAQSPDAVVLLGLTLVLYVIQLTDY